MHRRRIVSATALCAVGALTLAMPLAFAQNRAGAPVTINLYSGESGPESNVTLGSWGSGKAEASKDNVLVGATSIRVTTQGLYQGARVDFKSPVDLSAAFANPSTYIRLQVRFTGTGARQQQDFGVETRQVAASPFERMRFLVTMADGTRYELVRPITIPVSDDPDAFVPVAFPLAALLKKPGAEAASSAPTGDGAKIAQLAVFGDKTQQFYIGEIGVITDDTDINVSPVDEQVAFINDTLYFAGSAEGGASTLKYTWDFDARDGIQADRTGQNVQYTWRRAGTYTVTLTVSDVDGLKKPASTTVTIDVSE